MPRPLGHHKYKPLANYLAAQSGERLTLTFREIERLVGALPMGAFARSWWTNNVRKRNMAWVWRSAGWRVEAVETLNRRVTFVREEP